MRIFLLSALLVSAVSNSIAFADYMSGSVAFDSVKTPGTGSLNQSITFSNLLSSTGRGGFFSNLPIGTAWGNFSLSTAPATGSTIFVSNADFGTFSGIVTSDTSEFSKLASVNSFFRLVTIAGTWTPGSNSLFNGFTSNHRAELTISFNRGNTDDPALNGSITFQSYGTAVPEPSTFMFAGTALVGLVWLRRRRKQPADSTSNVELV
jgi:hypothetical protein